MRIAPVLLLSATVLPGCAYLSPQASSPAKMPTPIAVATLDPTRGNTANGTVSFVQKGDQILLDARIDGLTPGLHGFHVHEKGDCSAPDAMSAGGHFNPGGKPHGAPTQGEQHAGDFGNLNADANGRASLQLSIPVTRLSIDRDAANSVVGKALIVHADPDDLKTQPTGNSGARVACGVVSRK